MGRTAKIMGTLLQSEVAIRITQNESLMETMSRAMGMSIQLRHMIDAQIESAFRRRGAANNSEFMNQINILEQRVANLESAARRPQPLADQ